MPRSPRRKPRVPRKLPRAGTSSRVPAAAADSLDEQLVDDTDGEDQGFDEGDDPSEYDAEYLGDDDVAPDVEDAQVSPRTVRNPDAADVQPAFVLPQEETLESFVERFRRYVENDPDNYAFELSRVYPKVDQAGNPCSGPVQDFWNADVLTLEYLRRNFAPGQYKLAVRGIGANGKRGVYIGIFNNLKLARRNPEGIAMERPLDDASSPLPFDDDGGDDVGYGHHMPPLPPRPYEDPPGRAGGVDMKVMLDQINRSEADKERLHNEKLEIMQQSHTKEIEALREVAAASRPVASAPDVTAKALELLADQAKSGPREQSATEQRLLEQISALRDALALTQSKHIEEMSKLRGDHVQELFRERDASAKTREEIVRTYEATLDNERRRSDEARATLMTQHQAFVASLDAQSKAHTEAIRASLEARNQALTDQVSALRDTLSQERAATSAELSRLRTELSEERTRSMTSQHDLVLAKVEAQTAEVKGKLASDSLSNAGKMLANVKGFAEALGYVPAAAQAVAEAAPDSSVGTMARLAGAAAGLASSPEVLKFIGAAADRIRGTAGQLPQASAPETASAVAAWQTHRAEQRAASAALPRAQAVPQIAGPQPAPAVAAPRASAPPPPEVNPAPTDVQGMQDAIEDAALDGTQPEAFVGRIVQLYGIPLDTLRTAVAGATDAEVWQFLGVEPASLTMLAREFGASVMAWLRSPAPSP